MRQTYAVCVKVAGIIILFHSDREVDISHLSMLFKHHIIDEPAQLDHEIEFTGETERIIPADAQLAWKGYFHAVGHKGDHSNDVRKYVSADGSSEYFETWDGSCIINSRRENKTLCAMKVKRKVLTKSITRSNIDTVLMLLIQIVMASHHRYTLHAAAVEWRGSAIVFTGRSGQGKSTLSTDLAALGAGFLGDDIVFIYQEDGRLMIASLLFDAKLFESSKKTKDLVDILERHGCEKIDSMPLQAIAEVKQTRQGASYIEKEENTDRLFDTLLIAANNIALQYDHNDWLSLCALMLQDYHLYTFYFGDRKLLDKRVLDDFYDEQAHATTPA
ncbi:MAG: hypothetical protein IJU11_03005 [Prevotella sp.]|nr:hypothetical protein [Prevotella sp.]